MPSLYNSTPMPANAPKCYWHPDFAYPEPFARSSRLSPEERAAFSADEEARLFSKLESDDYEPPFRTYTTSVVKHAANVLKEMELEGYFNSAAFCPKDSLGSSNTQTIGGVPPKTPNFQD